MRLCFLAALTFTLFLTLQNKHPLIFLHRKVSAFSGENVSQRQEGGKLRSWYSGPTLVQVCSYSRRDVCVSLWASLVQEYRTIADKIPTFFAVLGGSTPSKIWTSWCFSRSACTTHGYKLLLYTTLINY